MRSLHYFLVVTLLFVGCDNHGTQPTTERWDVYEVTLEGPSSGNPFLDVKLYATFAHEDRKVAVPGFYDGDGIYKIRFSPDKEGTWTYETMSNQSELDEKRGEFVCIPTTGENHGPVVPVNTYYLEYADGTPYYAVGTTAYQWTSVKQTIQDQTVESLSTSPFNKVRMCVFPKNYRYGNDTEPWQYPFQRTDTASNLDQPNYDFFQNFDRRISQLMDLGIQADVILFHPYDEQWGYYLMGDERNERYVRYMIARISAYRNVWWSLANEWDIPKIKVAIDWEGIGTLLQEEDPHQRLRGIHNWYNTEDHFYDHREEWITHTSAQTAQFFNGIRWREMYQQPLLFDEMRYEGDVPSGWGNLTGQEMASYFWMAGLSGGYGTHGETCHNTSDAETEVRWWAKGGVLMGESPDRIQYFRDIMEEAPVTDMEPSLTVRGDSSDLNNNIYLFDNELDYFLAYVSDSASVVNVSLPERDGDYHVEVLDTWKMEVADEFDVQGGDLSYTTNAPYVALRIRATE